MEFEPMSFNHGVEGSSPSALTNKIKDLTVKYVSEIGHKNLACPHRVHCRTLSDALLGHPISSSSPDGQLLVDWRMIMKCPNCIDGFVSVMRPARFGRPSPPPPLCKCCKGTGVLPNPAPEPREPAGFDLLTIKRPGTKLAFIKTLNVSTTLCSLE
jgi:hypothetical protein